jgi:hypothetical protein
VWVFFSVYFYQYWQENSSLPYFSLISSVVALCRFPTKTSLDFYILVIVSLRGVRPERWMMGAKVSGAINHKSVGLSCVSIL